jgi:16S rRNA (cytidine1402-2'-O)-methyltransferase
MPAISDPGEDLVRLCLERGIKVEAVPGPCAFATALAVSGMPSRRFTFEGFLSTSKSERRERLSELASEQRTMIFYEAPHKLRGTLDDLLAHFGGDREISLCREITKLNEEVCRTTLAEAVEIYKEKEPRGEYVLVIAGAKKAEIKPDYPDDPVEHVNQLIESGMSKMDAVKAAAKARGVPKNEIYNLMNRD